MENIVQDDYRNLTFKPVKNINQLKVGMMMQVAESNELPVRWAWTEVSEKLLLKLSPENLRWLRLPNY